MRAFLGELIRNRAGATAIEFGLIAAPIAAVTIPGLATLGTSLNTKHNDFASSVSSTG